MKQIPVCNPPFNYADTTVSPQLVTNLISSCSTSSSPLTKINVNLYQLILATCVRTVVEAGSSFGVSTIYLALAVDQNSPGGKVIATEKEVSKVRRAREHWREAGKEVEKAMDLREGDLLQTLKEGLWEVDLLLLDSKILPIATSIWILTSCQYGHLWPYPR
jgi:hypothetical protein